MKGSITDNAGMLVYKKADEGLNNDCNIVVGLTPGMIFYDPSKQEVLDDVFRQVAEMLT